MEGGFRQAWDVIPSVKIIEEGPRCADPFYFLEGILLLVEGEGVGSECDGLACPDTASGNG